MNSSAPASSSAVRAVRSPSIQASNRLQSHVQQVLSGLPVVQSFAQPTSRGETLQLTNLLARFNPQAQERVLLVAHWDTRPRADMSRNAAEREMKRQALNRKNSLFVGNERGGRTAAVLSSLTSTCRRHGTDPQLYLTQLLANLPSTPLSQLDA